uniref:Uncharacterized protein n=1 Tax=Anguilla anguilla TaxID=7936 RepID=A0A0E9XQ79_ANGAN
MIQIRDGRTRSNSPEVKTLQARQRYQHAFRMFRYASRGIFKAAVMLQKQLLPEEYSISKTKATLMTNQRHKTLSSEMSDYMKNRGGVRH